VAMINPSLWVWKANKERGVFILVNGETGGKNCSLE